MWCIRRVMVTGKPMWVKPHYTKIWKHKLPNGQKVTVKAGTQIIDRFWGHLRTYLKLLRARSGPLRLPVKFGPRSGHTGIEAKTFGSPPARCFRIFAPNRMSAAEKGSAALHSLAVSPSDVVQQVHVVSSSVSTRASNLHPTCPSV